VPGQRVGGEMPLAEMLTPAPSSTREKGKRDAAVTMQPEKAHYGSK